MFSANKTKEVAEKVEKQIPRGLNSPHEAQMRRFAGAPIRPLVMTKISDLHGVIKAAPLKPDSWHRRALLLRLGFLAPLQVQIDVHLVDQRYASIDETREG